MLHQNDDILFLCSKVRLQCYEDKKNRKKNGEVKRAKLEEKEKVRYFEWSSS